VSWRHDPPGHNLQPIRKFLGAAHPHGNQPDVVTRRGAYAGG
jgi:hypothetical protein